MGTSIYEYSIANVGLDNVLNVSLDLALGQSIGDPAYVFEITENAGDDTTAGIIRDTVYINSSSDSKILVENALAGMRDVLTLGGVGTFYGLYSYLKLVTPSLDSDVNFTTLVNKLTELEELPTTKTVVADGLTSALLGARYADIGNSIRIGAIGNLDSLPIDSSKISLQMITDIGNTLISIFSEHYATYPSDPEAPDPAPTLVYTLGKLAFNMLTGFDVEYNKEEDKIEVIKGVSLINPGALSIGFGTNQVKGSVSGLELILRNYQGEQINGTASLSSGATEVKLRAAMSSTDKLRALENNPTSVLIDVERDIVVERATRATRRKNNFDIVIASATGEIDPSYIAKIQGQRDVESNNETYYNNQVTSLSTAYDELVEVGL